MRIVYYDSLTDRDDTIIDKKGKADMWNHFKQSLKIVLSAAMLAGAFMPLYAEESEEDTIEMRYILRRH